MRFRRLLPFAFVLTVLAMPVLASAAFAAPSGKEVHISMVDFRFEPKTATIDVGDTVVWTNNGSSPHTVSASDGSWDSGSIGPGQTFSHTFDKPGTVAYYCKFHGTANGSGMAGTLTVQTASTRAAPAPAATQAPSVSAPQQPAAQPSGAASIEVNDQPLDEGYITIPMVMAEQDGWVVVHANTVDNKPGAVLGHAAVKAGMNKDVEVTLNPAPKPGDKVWPMLHIDAGKKGLYEFPGPDAPVVKGGNIVMKQITILAGSEGGETKQGNAPSGATGAMPKALPNTGEADPTNLWLMPLAAGLLLLLSGGILLSGARADRRR